MRPRSKRGVQGLEVDPIKQSRGLNIVLQIAVMGVKFFHVTVPLEDMVEFMDANMVRIGVLVCQV